MNISVIDGSNYFKGLLLLIRKDNKISKEEHALITRIGKTLGFEKMFIENAVNEILDNKYISTAPPVFSTKEIAEKFLKDGFTLAASDKEIHPHEEAWLYSVAGKNNIEKEWLSVEKKNILHNKIDKEHLEVDNLKVIY
jgi:tRNA G18 (ribose-2'-O)-methylase SpoU